jgi:hypothetical protein
MTRTTNRFAGGEEDGYLGRAPLADWSGRRSQARILPPTKVRVAQNATNLRPRWFPGDAQERKEARR